MSALYLLCVCLAAEPPTATIKLLADDAEYARAAGKEATLDGLLERTPVVGRVGGGARFNAYRLRYEDLDGKEAVRELHLGMKSQLVAGLVGKKVRARGKLLEFKVEGGTILELWPAWVQPLTGPAAPEADGIIARCDWQPESARKRGSFQYIFRSGEQLADAMRVRGASAAETATSMIAQRLRVPAVDWEKHMLVCVSAGLQGPAVEGLFITRVRIEMGVLRVYYRLVPGNRAGFGIGYPAQTVLVDRFAGEVRFELQTAPRP